MGRRHRGRRLVTHGESGRSGVGRTRNVVAPTSLGGQFEQPFGPMGPPTLFTVPVLRYMKTYGLTQEQLAMVSVVPREWAAKNPRAIPGRPALAGRPGDADHRRGRAELAMIAYPFRLLQCCLVTDGGRRFDPGCGRARSRLPAKLAPGSEQGAGLPPRHRRECRDADGEPHPSFPRKRESRAARVSASPWDPPLSRG